MAICKFCGIEFIPHRKAAGVYCGQQCCYNDRKQNGRPELVKPKQYKVCGYCGKLFITKPGKVNYYCTRECAKNALRGHDPVWISCPTCGTTFLQTCNKLKFCSKKCAAGAKKKYSSVKEGKAAYRARQKEKRHKIREEQKQQRAAEKERLAQEKLEKKKHPCAVCGTITTRRKYCCDQCARRARNKTKEISRRTKVTKALIDKDITLDRLFIRDHGVCHICGLMCDMNDYEICNEMIIAGNKYPSIDHVIPLSKGGKHSWENVKLAHRICNSMKRDKQNYPISCA